jgi:hypothetical protein
VKMKHSFRFSVLLLAALSMTSVAQAQHKAKPAAKKQTTTTAAVEPSPTPMATPVEAPAAAEPVVTEPTPAPAPATAREISSSSSESNFLIGPYVTALALPRPFSAGLESKYAGFIGLSGSYGFLPELSLSDVKLKLNGWDARVKIYPLQGAFFIGIGYGKQTFTGSQTRTINGIPTTGTIAQDNNFFFPHIGWNWGSTTRGFFMGIDLGVQISTTRTTNFSTTQDSNPVVTSSTEYNDLKKDILDKAETIGKTPLPLLSLIKVGYLF